MPADSRSLLEIAQSYSAPGLPVRATIVGVLPGFLMHSADQMQLNTAAAEAHRANGKRSKFIPSPQQEAEWGAYRNEDGNIYLPTRCLLRCLIEAAKAFKMPKSRVSMKYAVAAGVTVPRERGLGFPLLDIDTGEPISEYQIDTQRAVVQRAAIMRSRSLVPSWSCDIDLLIDTEAVLDTMFAELLGYAGSRIGVGDNRPEKGGQYGRFTVASLETVV